MPTLLEIGEEVRALQDLLDELEDGDITEVEATIDKWIKETSGALNVKLDGYCALIREKELLAAARREEAERLMKRVRVDENLAVRLEDRLRLFMKSTGNLKIETNRYKLSVCKNGGKVPLVFDVPPEKLPEKYRNEETTYKADSDTIRADLAAGISIPGCSLGARGDHLRIS